MSGLIVEARLRRALTVSAARAGASLTVTRSDATRWASATFAGARHELVIEAVASDAVEQWLEGLPEAELAVPGHLVADLKVVAVTQAGVALTVTLEVLTVEER